MDIKYILFDNDGTLMDFALAQEKALEKSYCDSGLSHIIPYSEKVLQCYDSVNKEWWAKLERGECTKAELQLGRFEDFFKSLGIEKGDAADMCRRYAEELGNGRFILEGAKDITEKLSRRYEIYITTNGVASIQHSRIDSCEYVDFIKGIFVSEEAGFAKPHKEYFDYVMEKIGDRDPQHYIVIGDSLSSDILGANNAGIPCVWFNPKGTEKPENLRIEYIISSLNELENILLS